jgi:large subunit ribosomal protein L19
MKSMVVTSPVNMEERKNLGIRSGDTVRVWQKIVELKTGKGANKKEVQLKNTRLQAFEGLVLAVKHGTEAGATFTVRKVASGVGVERIFPLYAPTIDKVEILRRARVRRAKLYYIRDKAAREVRRSMRRTRSAGGVMETTEVSEAPAATEAAAE